MKYIYFNQESNWAEKLARPLQNMAELSTVVRKVMDRVRDEGDRGLLALTQEFDRVSLTDIQVSQEEMSRAVDLIDDELKAALKQAKANIELFHRSQEVEVEKIETQAGVQCWRESRPIDTVGLYIPGGTAPLLSTVLMLAVPAVVAGCPQIVLCSPPNRSGQIHPAILYAASLCGVHAVYKVGGSQAIAAMTYGTDTVVKVNKIFGPGNQYVTCAKVLAQQEGVAIDMPAGPSEVLVWCDDEARPDFVAADLLAQAEHGVDSQVVLVCDSPDYGARVEAELERQLEFLPRRDIIKVVLENSSIVVANEKEAIEVINFYAPEHLIIQRNTKSYQLADIANAGSVFIGPYTPESAGDYASGTNHTLPTNGFATAYSGVSLDSFVKKITFQEISKTGLTHLEKIISPMAAAEELEAHRRAVLIRLDKQ
ncbi:histidinol dehydrogenase [Membranihabitans marinus]|uniref:histidinol dehydrogenase n=1 Tax=Membranihabitans marinus TaxID=1227546 RepID=UPI001F011AB8|nr:histidinol dehydrogenase [Membranihabitans marinus]